MSRRVLFLLPFSVSVILIDVRQDVNARANTLLLESIIRFPFCSLIHLHDGRTNASFQKPARTY